MGSASNLSPFPYSIVNLPFLLLLSSRIFLSISSLSRPASISLPAESARTARRVAYRMFNHTLALSPPLGWASRNQLKTETSVASFFSRCKALSVSPSHRLPSSAIDDFYQRSRDQVLFDMRTPKDSPFSNFNNIKPSPASGRPETKSKELPLK